MSKPFEVNVTSRYGAPMGRRSDPVSGFVHLERVPAIDGDYDPGGAYWGGINDRPLFCAWNAEGAAYARAPNREQAKEAFPDCTFYDAAADYSLDVFLEAYVTAALWSSTDDAGEPLDASYGFSDLAPKTLERMREDCEAFLAQNVAFCLAMGEEQAGHDFWLTRNGHGCGFWDRGLGEVGDKLADAATAFGEVYLGVGDDGKLYF